jgi:DNA ligase-1
MAPLHFCSANQARLSVADKQTMSTQLATSYQENIEVENYWISEKLDGIRARWNGSHLMTRNDNIIHAPKWFVADIPQQVIEGELWLARNSFEKTASIVLRDTPSTDWQNIKFMLFDAPLHKGNFSQRLRALHNLVNAAASPYLQVITHFNLTNKKQLMQKLDELVAQGAEGLMLHHKNAHYQDGRSLHLLKLKKHQDAEAIVIAHLEGKGKYKNMLGSLLVEIDNGLQFKIGSGFTDAQRKTPPSIGSRITYKYYGLTAKGIPRFASFLRVRQYE